MNVAGVARRTVAGVAVVMAVAVLGVVQGCRSASTGCGGCEIPALECGAPGCAVGAPCETCTVRTDAAKK